MRRHFIVTAQSLFIALALVAAAGCGRLAEQKKAAEDAQKAAQSIAQGAEQMAKSFEAMAKGAADAAAGGEAGPVEPVSFRDLQAVFPDLAGWEKGKPTGERMTQPVPFSQATCTYHKGDATIEAKLVDSGFNQLLLAPYAMFLAAGYEKETENGYEKSTKVASYPGWERWNSESKDGELNAVVNRRFLLTLEGNGLSDTKVLHELAQKADLGKLAGLK